MSNDTNIFGCFVSYPSVMYDATDEQKKIAKNQGDLFRIYIWGDQGICDSLKELKKENYGNDLELALFQFYVNPIEYELNNLKEIESYRKKEKSIGIPIIIDDENFFSKTEQERYNFLKQSILQKMEVLLEVVKKKKLDTKMDLLKSDLRKVLEELR
ncbi:hypothetical protein LF887_04210 [Chryseobacterium sp. MEBOG06]|uniref:hypothetical protein n=1 Tax=Chryseobacterium sp. MEBOG06 TaxID=2879938 RepID=UPI001F419074|nr:hypothetical protein [Chryseobacterium sp. MEBOG06]UKB84847.1 hypothetical protein LF887_04210 [Chryseobacterium sp. MEBOG06]